MMNVFIVLAVLLAIGLAARFWIFPNWFTKRKTERDYENNLSRILATDEGKRVAEEIRLVELSIERANKETLSHEAELALVKSREANLRAKQSLLQTLKKERVSGNEAAEVVEDSQDAENGIGKLIGKVLVYILAIAAVLVLVVFGLTGIWKWIIVVPALVAVIGLAIFILRKLRPTKPRKLRPAPKPANGDDDEADDRVKLITDKFFPKNLWVAFSALLVALPLAVAIGGTLAELPKIPTLILTIAAVLVSILMSVLAIKKAWTPVPEMDEVVVTLFEKYYGTIKESGLCLPFPLFGWVELHGANMEDDDALLFQVFDEKAGKIITAPFDLKNASLPLIAPVFFRIVNSYDFFFGHKDSTQAMIKYVESYMKRVFVKPAVGNPRDKDYQEERLMMLEEAMLMKSKDVIGGFLTEDSEAAKNQQAVNSVYPDHAKSHHDFVKSHWGIEVFSIQIRDFALTESQRQALDSVLVAQKKKEVAKEHAEEVVNEADGKSRARIKEAEGEAQAIERLAVAGRKKLEETAEGYATTMGKLFHDGMGVMPDETLRHLQLMEKWGNPNSININGDMGGGPGFGATLEAGRNAFNRQNERRFPKNDQPQPRSDQRPPKNDQPQPRSDQRPPKNDQPQPTETKGKK
ncbi:MAG: hypothetical protein PHV97_03205 [Candidatus Omnitrophica bacterium]|nr:hypothetical protein [Candidatus Omnitrophota bacterium]